MLLPTERSALTLRKEFTFDSSHRVPTHKGKCKELHGHTWRVKVALTGPVQFDTGFVIDYGIIDKLVKPLIELLDHRHLNWFFVLPTSEALSYWFLRVLAPLKTHYLLEVSVSETPKTECSALLHNIQVCDLGGFDAMIAAPFEGSLATSEVSLTMLREACFYKDAHDWGKLIDLRHQVERDVAEAIRSHLT